MKRKLICLILVFLPSISQGFAGSAVSLLDDLYRLTSVTVKVTKKEFGKLLWKNPYKIQSFVHLPVHSKMVVYTHLAVKNKVIPITKQTYYINKFSKIQNGDDLLIKSIMNKNNLDNVLKDNMYFVKLKNLRSEAIDTINRIKKWSTTSFSQGW
ncbi:secreted protein [Beggiatoa sp. PS]|nr:secreted protein [Beggiatoa sp. PS]